MKKFLLLTSIFLVNVLSVSAQTTTVYMYDNTANNFSGSGVSGVYRNVGSSVSSWRFQRLATFTGNNFWKVYNQSSNSDNDFNNPGGSKVWSNNVSVGSASAQTYFAYGDGNGGAGSYAVTNGRYYTFTFQDVNTSSNSSGYVMETTSAPVTISSVSRTPSGAVAAGTNVTVSGTISANLPSDQKLYIRFSTNSNFSSSTINSIGTTGSNSYSTTIPLVTNTNGTTVYYYIFTSTYTLTGASSDIELKTMELSSVSNYTPQCPTANAGGPNSVCQSATPSAITLSGSSFGGTASTAAWSIVSGGGSLSSTSQTATPDTVTYTPAANYNGPVTLRLTTDTPGSCSAGTSDRTITVNALPTATISGATSVCSSNSTILKASGGTSFNWDNAGFTSSATKSYSSPTTAVSVVVKDANGCNSSAATTTIVYNTCVNYNSNASSATYNGGLSSGQNDNVCGFGNWAVTTNGNSAQTGSFTATSSNSDCDVLTSGKAWGIYANNNGGNSPTSSAVRPLIANMVNNTQLSFRFDNGSIDGPTNAGTVGFGIQNTAGENLVEVYFTGGGSFYVKNDSSGASNTNLGFTSGGLNVVFTLTSSTTYVITLNSISNSTISEVITGTLMNPSGGQVPRQVRFFNFRGGAAIGTNTYFNDLNFSLSSNPMSAVLSGTTSVCPGNSANLSVAITDPSGLVANGYTVVYNTIPSSSNITVNNYTSGANISVSPGSTTQYILVSVTRTTGGCTASVSGTPTVTIKPLPQLSTGNITPACGATTADLTSAASSSNGGALSYFSDNYITSVGNPTAVTNAQTYYVRATLNGCTTDGTIIVNAFRPTYTITASAGSNGSISPNGVSTVCSGNGQSYVITANSGYHIADVKVNGVSVGAVGTYNFTNVTSNQTIDATFAINTYTITANASFQNQLGSISPYGANVVNEGGSQTFTITPFSCYSIANVFIDGNPILSSSMTTGDFNSGGTYTFTNVQANHTISVTWVQSGPYTITVTSGANGSISPGSGDVSCGSSPTFTITPNACYAIQNVIVDGVSQGPISSYTFTNVQSAHSISATFVQKTYTITAIQGSAGDISPYGTVTLNCGQGLDYFIRTDECHGLTDVLVDGVSVMSNVTQLLQYTYVYNFSNVQANHTITAIYSTNTYTITTSAGANGTISPGSGSVNCGTSPTYTITADSGYHVVDVVIDSVSQGPLTSYTFTNVKANHTISATFAVNCTNVSLVSASAIASPICNNTTTTLTYSGLSGTNASVTWYDGSGGTGGAHGTFSLRVL